MWQQTKQAEYFETHVYNARPSIGVGRAVLNTHIYTFFVIYQVMPGWVSVHKKEEVFFERFTQILERVICDVKKKKVYLYVVL